MYYWFWWEQIFIRNQIKITSNFVISCCMNTVILFSGKKWSEWNIACALQECKWWRWQVKVHQPRLWMKHKPPNMIIKPVMKKSHPHCHHWKTLKWPYHPISYNVLTYFMSYSVMMYIYMLTVHKDSCFFFSLTYHT